MPIIPIENVGRVGIIVDDKPHNLPPEAWTDGKNVRFSDNAASKMQGQIGFSGAATILSAPVYRNVIVPTGTLDYEYPVVNTMSQNGDSILIGAPWKSVGGLSQVGIAYLYDLDANGLHTNERAILTAPDVVGNTKEGANFGTSMAMSSDGKVLAISARLENQGTLTVSNDAGAVYIFDVGTDGTITQRQRIANNISAQTSNYHFGASISLSGDGLTLAIGQPYSSGDWSPGNSYVYVDPGTGVFAYDFNYGDGLLEDNLKVGMQVALSRDGNWLAVGKRISGTNFAGEVMIFKRTAGVWNSTPIQTLNPSDQLDGVTFGTDFFGIAAAGASEWEGKSLAFSSDGSVLIVGAYYGFVNEGLNDTFASGTGSWLVNGTATIANVSGELEVTFSSDVSNAVYQELAVTALIPIWLGMKYTEGNAPTKDVIINIGTTLGGTDYGSYRQTASAPNLLLPLTPAFGVTSLFVTMYLEGGITAETFYLDNIILASRPGKVYAFDRTGDVFAESQIIVPAALDHSGNWTGWSVAVDDTAALLLIGSQQADSLTITNKGLTTQWNRVAGTYTEGTQIDSQDVQAFNYYGYKISIAGDATKFAISDTYEINGRSRTEIFAGSAITIPNDAHWLLPWKTLTQNLWVYSGTSKIYKTDGNTHTDISRYTTTPGDNPYDASSRPIWTGGVLHGVPVMNHRNGTDYPQQWSEALGRMVDLTAWPATNYCKVLRTFKNFLVALDVTQGSVRYPYMVKWSSVADPGQVPASWAINDPTILAGEVTLAQSNGFLVDCAPLGDLNIVYKYDSIWGMQFVGGNDVFRFFEISSSIGALAPRCIQAFYKQHLVVGRNDIVLLDGNVPKSIVNKRMRKWFFDNVNPSFLDYTVVTLNPPKQEIWIGFVEAGSTSEYLTKALVWNWDQNTWAVRELPDISFMAYGNISSSFDTFDGSVGVTFDLDLGTFDGSGVSDAKQEIMFSKAYINNELFHGGVGYTNDGVNYTSYLERTGLAIAGTDRQGNPKVDPSMRKFLRAVYPKISAPTPVNLLIYAGGHETPDGSITWEGPYTFNSGTDLKVDFSVNAPYLAVRFEDTGNLPWEMTGYGLDIEIVSRF